GDADQGLLFVVAVGEHGFPPLWPPESVARLKRFRNSCPVKGADHNRIRRARQAWFPNSVWEPRFAKLCIAERWRLWSGARNGVSRAVRSQTEFGNERRCEESGLADRQAPSDC